MESRVWYKITTEPEYICHTNLHKQTITRKQERRIWSIQNSRAAKGFYNLEQRVEGRWTAMAYPGDGYKMANYGSKWYTPSQEKEQWAEAVKVR